MKIVRGLPMLLVIAGVRAFAPSQAAHQAAVVTSISRRDVTRIEMSSSPTVNNHDKGKTITNPSTAFGAPISDEMKEFNKKTVSCIKSIVFDLLFAGEDRDYARFYALETIARVPYFSYLSVLHLYETIGRWRKANYLRIHFAESYNELHHLLICEELGGADCFQDRFIAQHVAVFYYFFVCLIYMINPVQAYHLNECVEEHAFLTYDKFLQEKGDELKQLPPPKVAKEYYETGDLYMFDEFQTNTLDTNTVERRRPEINNLYDVFVAIRQDELEHCKTMAHLQTDMEVASLNDETCWRKEQAAVESL